MGDRGNIVIAQHKYGQAEPVGYIYFYSHWGGSSLPLRLQRALQRKQRWTDESYLARIIFSEMIKDEVGSETGYGISMHIGDNSYPLLVVNSKAQTVGATDEGSPDKPFRSVSFTDFCKLDELTLSNFRKM